MCKFVVVLYRKKDWSRERFRRYLEDVHGPMAEEIPGVLRYIQNHVVEDPHRNDPGWDAVVELYWETREAMEAAWRTPEGQSATSDLAVFADPTRTTWSVVDEQLRR